MQKDFSSGASWNSAAAAGLAMALVTIAASFIQGLSGKIGGLAGGFVSFIALVAKIAVCILVFRWLLMKFSSSFADITADRLKSYGLKIALFSGLIVSAYSLASILYIDPDTYKEAIDQAMQSYSSMLDSNSMSMMDDMMQKMPAITFFASWVYCFLWGWMLTGIFTKSIVPNDPFADYFQRKDDETNDNNI
jgi:hypothetical protein